VVDEELMTIFTNKTSWTSWTSYFELITVNVGYYARIEGSQSAKGQQSSKFISYKLYIMIGIRPDQWSGSYACL